MTHEQNVKLEDLQRQLREMTFLSETSRVLTATLDLDSVLHSLMAQVRDYFDVEATSVALLDEETDELVFRVAVGDAAEDVVGLRLARGQGVAGWVLDTGQTYLVPVAHQDERFYSGIDDKTGFLTNTMLAVPIMDGGQAIGVIEILNPSSGEFSEAASQLLLSVADVAAVAIRNAALYERVHEAELRYENLFNQNADGVIVLDPDGQILNLNWQAKQFLVDLPQVIGRDFSDLMGLPEDECLAWFDAALAGQTVHQGTPPSLAEKGWVLETHLTGLDYGGGEAIQWVGHDISTQVELEQMQEDFIHMVVHDLRNPLGSIMNSLQLIHTAYVEQDQTLPVTQLLALAMRSGQKLYNLIDSMLDLRRFEAGETDLEKVLVEPAVLVTESVEQIQPMVLGKRQTLTVDIADDLPEIYVDYNIFVRVLNNLLDNAVKFTHPEGEITLTVKRDENEIIFVVEDTGIGIAPENWERIFDRFSRLQHSDDIKGTGLGLTFCKLAVEAHGGQIWVESELEQGASFYVTLPLRIAE